MLLNVHVKNLALIDEVDVYFDHGLNILTGETGAGKSIIIGSINIALGAKVSKEMIREHAEYALVELVFQVEDKIQIQKLKELDLSIAEDGQLILSRKIMGARSISRVNGEVVPIAVLKEIADIVIDIHGQHEHQSLLYKRKHLEILDEFSKEDLLELKEVLIMEYDKYTKYLKQLKDFSLDEEQRAREVSFLNFEIEEIKDAELKLGEDEELEAKYRKLVNSKRIMEVIADVHEQLGYEQMGSAGEVVGRASGELQTIASYDEELRDLSSQLQDIDQLLSDFNREAASYLSNLSFETDNFTQIEERLNLLNRLKSKYGKTIQEVLLYKETKEQQLDKLVDYEVHLNHLKKNIVESEKILEDLSMRLSTVRKSYAKRLEENIINALIDLNFLEVKFEIDFKKQDKFSANGTDDICFLISTNPGEPLKELSKVASGGELSRIMLAIKTILADKDLKKTLIFDEIDVGISGRTAQKVSEKLSVISRNHQVICITHLPQIASMADQHYIIEKEVHNNKTVTSINKLNDEQTITELARILGGAAITDTVRKNAYEMKQLADKTKTI
jgi:DNA repair protein RecN (Recombination protein N)